MIVQKDVRVEIGKKDEGYMKTGKIVARWKNVFGSSQTDRKKYTDTV